MTEEYNPNEWLSIERLLNIEKISAAKIGEAIEYHNIRFCDSINRRKLANSESIKIALDLLIAREESINNSYDIFEDDYDEDPRALESPLYQYGWFRCELPDFSMINPNDDVSKHSNNSTDSNAFKTSSNSESNSIRPIFSNYKSLRPNQISIVMLNNDTAQVVIKGKTIAVSSTDFNLVVKSQGWKLIQSACMNSGDLTQGLKQLNNKTDQVKNHQIVTTAISRLNGKLLKSMGLESNPIVLNGGYKFIFKSMTHEMLDGPSSSKQDAMDYTSNADINDYDLDDKGDFDDKDDF